MTSNACVFDLVYIFHAILAAEAMWLVYFPFALVAFVVFGS